MIRITLPANQQHSFLLVTGGLILACWLLLAAWNASPYAELLNHKMIGAETLSVIPRLLLFLLSWTLMTIAMMLPASLNRFVSAAGRCPLASRDATASRTAVRHARSFALLVAGYLSIWTLFGLLAYLGHSLLLQTVNASPARSAISAALPPFILLVAGLYQLTPAKRTCTMHCQSPNSAPSASPFSPLRTGLQHGLFCAGSCWALMLTMFASGHTNLIWMLILAAIMVGERAGGWWGQQLTQVVGVLLIVWAAIWLVAGGAAHVH